MCRWGECPKKIPDTNLVNLCDRSRCNLHSTRDLQYYYMPWFKQMQQVRVQSLLVQACFFTCVTQPGLKPMNIRLTAVSSYNWATQTCSIQTLYLCTSCKLYIMYYIVYIVYGYYTCDTNPIIFPTLLWVYKLMQARVVRFICIYVDTSVPANSYHIPVSKDRYQMTNICHILILPSKYNHDEHGISK